VSASAQTPGLSSRRNARVNAVAATAFLIGGSLFALGAALTLVVARAESAAVAECCRPLRRHDRLRDQPRRLFHRRTDPGRLRSPRLVTDMVGCALFLISGHLAMAGIAGRFWHRRDLGWWIIASRSPA
jgi:hypothetical protein